MPARTVGTRLPCCPGRDSRYTIRHNPNEAGSPWWVYYQPPEGDLIPADESHADLVEIVNVMKRESAGSEGGAFSINEHSQIVARAPGNDGQGAKHVIHVTPQDTVSTYAEIITFRNGELDPTAIPAIGETWPGPLTGISYSFAAPGNRQAPSRMLDEVFVTEEGAVLQLSAFVRGSSYPPAEGQLAEFLRALRRQFPIGGRFRVNEHGRAFSSDGNIFIGTVPLDEWFPPLTSRS